MPPLMDFSLIPTSSQLVNLHLNTLVLLLLLASFIVLLFDRCWWQPNCTMRRLKQQGLQVLPYVPVVGNALRIHRMLEAARRADARSPSDHDILRLVMPFFNATTPVYGKSYVYWWGTMPTLAVTNPEYVKEILSTKFKHYEKNHTVMHALGRIFGRSVLSVDGQDWERHRRILSPAFFGDKLKVMATDMALCAAQLCVKWEKIVEDCGGSAEIEVAADLKVTTADIIARTCFGSNYDKGKKVFQNQSVLAHYTFQNLLNFAIPAFRYLPTPLNLKCWSLEREVKKDLREIVESRLDLIRREGTSACGMDLLGIMLAQNEQLQLNKQSARLSIQEVMDQCKTFFLAGHETTASLLSWTMLMLALHPEWQERCRMEVLEVMCGQEKQPIGEDSLSKLRNVGMVLNETLRLYPPVVELVARDPAEPKKGKDNERLSMAIMVAAIHRDKELWGEDAGEFKPQRFAWGVAKASKDGCYAFLPFAGGPRNCMGQKFAIMEAKLVVSSILAHFRFQVAPSYVHSPQLGLTLKPHHGLQLMLTRLK